MLTERTFSSGRELWSIAMGVPDESGLPHGRQTVSHCQLAENTAITV